VTASTDGAAVQLTMTYSEYLAILLALQLLEERSGYHMEIETK
jgi:hypothetical protein